MSYSYRIRGARWLRMWTAADRSSVYAAQSEAQKIADTLCDVPWTRAKSDGPAMFPLTAAKTLDENPANRDLFDAALFCAEHSDGAHRAYANAAMYLFKLPSTSGVSLKSVTVHVESDAYNALGARIAVHLLSSAELPTVCAVVRTGDAHAEGVAARRTVERDGRNYWYSNSADVTITGGTSESPAAIGELTQYLAGFVGRENYATSRNEWLEGASYIRNLIEIETDAVVTGWTDGSTHECANEGAAPEFNVTRAMAAHGRQGRSFKFAAERLSNGWQVPEATGTAPSKGGYWSSSSDHSPSNRAVEIEFPVVGAAICPALETGAYSLCVELRAGGDGNVLPALRFRALAYNGTLTSGAAALDYRTGTMDDLRPLSAYKLLSGGAARSVMLVGSAGMSTAVAATGASNARGKAGLLVVGGDDGVHVLGMAAEFNPDTNAYFRITADDGTPIFSIEKTDAMVVGANAAGITVGESSIVIPVPVVSPDPPTMYWRQHLDSGDWADESSPPAGATVTWTGEAGARVCTISFSGTRYNGQAQATALCRAGRPAVFLHARN